MEVPDAVWPARPTEKAASQRAEAALMNLEEYIIIDDLLVCFCVGLQWRSVVVQILNLPRRVEDL